MEKIKNEHGSAMLLSIIATMIISTFLMIIGNQIINNMKTTIDNYDDIEVKYIAESGIERSIADIQNQISGKLYSEAKDTKLYDIDHSKHDGFVTFNEKGEPDKIDFLNCIIRDLFDANQPSSIDDGLNGDSIYMLSTNFIWYIDSVKPGIGTDIMHNHVYVIRDILNDKIYNNGNIVWSQENKLALEYEIELLLDKIDKTIEELSDNINALNYLNRVKNIILELKCRLKMNNSNSSQIEYKNIDIHIPNYEVYKDDRGNLIFKDVNKINGFCKTDYNHRTVKLQLQSNKVISMDFEDLNEELIYSTGKSKENRLEYKMNANIDFLFEESDEGKYFIKQNVVSYGKEK